MRFAKFMEVGHHPAGGTFADATSARPSHRPREPAGGDRLKGAGARSASPPFLQIRYFSVMLFSWGPWARPRCAPARGGWQAQPGPRWRWRAGGRQVEVRRPARPLPPSLRSSAGQTSVTPPPSWGRGAPRRGKGAKPGCPRHRPGPRSAAPPPSRALVGGVQRECDPAPPPPP